MKRKKKRAFVLMPFGDPYDSYYTRIFKPSLQAAGYSVSRADDLFQPRPIMQDIQISILQSDLLLSEMSGKNPNVFYELGLAHAIGKPVILVSHEKEDIPFDLRHIRLILYDYTEAGWERKLSANISLAAKAVATSNDIWPLPLLPQTRELSPLGIKKILPQRKDASLITEALSNAVSHGRPPKRIQMMGQSFAWLKDKGDELLTQLLKTKCKFRFLLLDPNSKLMSVRTSQENPDLKNEARGFVKWICQSFGGYGLQIELRLHDLSPTMGMTIIDSHTLYVSPYAMTQRTHVMPMLILAEGGLLFKTFSHEFDSVWEKGYPMDNWKKGP